MIFVTVGTQLGFDRLIRQVDFLAGEYTSLSFFAQIGESKYLPFHLESVQYLSPSKFEEKVNQSSLVIAHAGIGTIIVALKHNKRTLVYPRRAILKEQRNEHQLHTAKFLEGLNLPLITVAYGAIELRVKFSKFVSQEEVHLPITSKRDSLIFAIRNFIVEGHIGRRC